MHTEHTPGPQHGDATRHPPPLLLGIPETCARLGISRSSVYVLIGQGRLRVLKIGRRTLVPDAECRAFVDRQLLAEATP